MTAASTIGPLDPDGPAAPPRANGELVFSAPWESRAFGLAMTLHANGCFVWEDFRQALIARINEWEAAPPEGECWSYYTCWMAALEQVLATEQLVAPAEVDARIERLAALPAGHDHRHDDHDHDHEH